MKHAPYLPAPHCANLNPPGSHGGASGNFKNIAHSSTFVTPKIAAPGKPWVWRTSFPDYHPEVGLELLHNGFHIGFIDCIDMLGADPALDLMDTKGHQGTAREPGLAGWPPLAAGAHDQHGKNRTALRVFKFLLN